MTWTAETQQDLLAEYLLRFSDKSACRAALNAYINSSYALDEQRARNWLERALLRDEARARISDPENTVVGPSTYELTRCYHCRGRGYVRKDVPVSHAEFGKAFRCPACTGRSPDASDHCEKCAAFVEEEGGEESGNFIPGRDYVGELAAAMRGEKR